MQQPAFFMQFRNDDSYFGNFELLKKRIVSFLAANDTPEVLWTRVEQWLEHEIYGTDKVVLSHFDTPFEKRVMQLLLKRNHPIMLFTYNTPENSSLNKLNISPSTPNILVLKYRPLHNEWRSKQTDMKRMAVINLADEFITIGVTSDRNILTILDLYQQSPEKPHRVL